MPERMNRWIVAFAAAVLMIALPSQAAAQTGDDRLPSLVLVNDFYESLDGAAVLAVPRETAAQTVEDMMTEDAVVALDDLGVTLTRDEFVESLDALFDALAGGRVIHRIEAPDGNTNIKVAVCYAFASNQMLVHETLAIADGRITAMLQEQASDTCDDL